MKTGVRTVLAALAGSASFVALFAFSGDDSDPPKYRSVFGYRVPTGGIWLALAAGIIAGVLVWMVLRKNSREANRDSTLP